MKIEALQKIINNIHRENGEGFEVDQKEIEKAFSVEESAFSNITIKVLSVAGGILAAVLLTGFLFIAGISNSSAGMIITGVALTAVSIIAAKNLTNLTLDTMSITLYVVGVVMISAGFENIDGSHEYLPFILIAIAITTLFFSEGFMLVFAGTLLFHGALVYYFADRNLNLLIQLPILLCCL